jgi:hypothetical protein
MTEAQLKAFPLFRNLPVYDESEDRANSITTQKHIRECSTIQQVQACLRDPRLTPLGALRVIRDGGSIVVAYFGEHDSEKGLSH